MLSGAKRVMGVHGPMVTSSYILQKKLHLLHSRPIFETDIYPQRQWETFFTSTQQNWRYHYILTVLILVAVFFTLTCSLAWPMGLLHDETNTRLSIEQPMDLQKKNTYKTRRYEQPRLHSLSLTRESSVTSLFPVAERSGRCRGGRAQPGRGCPTGELGVRHAPPNSGWANTRPTKHTRTQINEPNSEQKTQVNTLKWCITQA